MVAAGGCSNPLAVGGWWFWNCLWRHFSTAARIPTQEFTESAVIQGVVFQVRDPQHATNTGAIAREQTNSNGST